MSKNDFVHFLTNIGSVDTLGWCPPSCRTLSMDRSCRKSRIEKNNLQKLGKNKMKSPYVCCRGLTSPARNSVFHFVWSKSELFNQKHRNNKKLHFKSIVFVCCRGSTSPARTAREFMGDVTMQ